jgi:hypothetical protein
MSEEAGIQMLGSDDIAITKIRLFSILSSSGIIFVAVIILKSFPPAIPSLMGHQNISFAEMLKQDNGSMMIYFVLPISAVLMTTITTLVRFFKFIFPMFEIELLQKCQKSTHRFLISYINGLL